MAQIDNGGAAFPFQYEQQNGGSTGLVTERHIHTGMSVRDYFAGQVLTGIFSVTQRITGNETLIAAIAYAVADAMIIERKSGAL